MSEGLGGYVRADEKVLWKGQPQQGLRFVGRDVLLVPVSLLWGGGVVSFFVLGGFPVGEIGFPFVLFPLIFGAAAFYVTVGRLLHDAWIRSRTEYAVTDKRVIVLTTGLGSDLTTLDIARIEQLRFKPRGDRGDIIFGREPGVFNLFGGRSFRSGFALWVPSLAETPQFQGIDNARRVFDQIEGLRARGGA